MKIGILTYHRAHNYGAVLQCYAMQETLKKMGHDVSVIDYRQPDIERVYKFHRGLSVKSLLKNKASYILPALYTGVKNELYRNELRKTRRDIFQSFCRRYLNLTSKCTRKTIPSDFDAYIIGSDMLWADDCMYGHFEPVYFGDFSHHSNAKIIGYAISGTPSSFERCGKRFNFSFLKNFTSVAIREKRLADIMSKYTHKDTLVTIDPTLLTERDIWLPMLNKKWQSNKYIVTYYVRVKGADRVLMDERAKRFAQNLGYNVINIDISLTNKALKVEDFVSIIAYAQYIITDSFHAMIFSMIFHRPFNVIKYNDPHDARYLDILEKIDLSDLAITSDSDFMIPSIDYSLVDPKLHDFRSSSFEYLSTNL